MNIHEYQAKKIFKKAGINVPYGLVAYTPAEAKSAAEKISEFGPWVVKAQIQAGSRDVGKFSDKRAGRKGGIRLSKTLDEVYEMPTKCWKTFWLQTKPAPRDDLSAECMLKNL